MKKSNSFFALVAIALLLVMGCKVESATPIEVESITINETWLMLGLGETQTLSATVTPDNAEDKTVIWSSDKTDIAMVNSDGTVRAISEGKATITARAGGKKATCRITVEFIKVERVSIEPSSVHFSTRGQTEKLTATITPNNASDKRVTWSSDNETIATVDNDGTVTAHEEGYTHIIAQAGDIKTECGIFVSPTVIAVDNITLDRKTLTLTPGMTETLAATVTPDNASNKTITWSSSNPDIATVNNAGTVTACKVGKTIITARTEDKKATCEITVKQELVAVESVSIEPKTITLEHDTTAKLTAIVTPDNADNKTVTWSSSDKTIATVDSDGTIKAGEAGIATIIAQAGDSTAECIVIVNPILVNNIALNVYALTIEPGKTGKLTAIVTPDNAINATVIWSSGDETVATVDSDGTVMAHKEGRTTIIAQAGGYAAGCEINVKSAPIAVEKVLLEPATLTLAPGETGTLTATVTPYNADNKTVTWSSSKETIAMVYDDGTVMAYADGIAIITAWADGKEATCEITVITEDSITLEPSVLYIKTGKTEKLTATVTPNNADNKTITWLSSDDEVATVDNDGMLKTVKAGTATITAQAGDKMAECTVIVEKPTMPYGEIDEYGVLTKYSGTEATVDIPDGVTCIGGNAFDWRSRLESVTIPDSVTSIGNGAFYRCTSLTSVTIPDSVTSIGNFAFGGCTSLTNVTIPDSVTSIGEYTFYQCTSLTNVTIPDSVTSIGEYTFYQCTSLTSVTIPGSVKTFGDYAFAFCKKLESVKIQNGVESIGAYAFAYCTSLKTVTIPGSVESIGAVAFKYCERLTNVTIGNGVTSIGVCAFEKCTNLESVIIPGSVESIGYEAFSGCTSLSSVFYNGTLADWCIISWGSGTANPLCNEKAILYIDDSELAVANIPAGVTSINAYAFYRYSGLKSVTIPDSVTSIEEYAFKDCTSLESVTIPNKVTSIGECAFKNCTNLKTIYYRGSTENWNSIKTGTDWDLDTGNYTIECTE